MPSLTSPSVDDMPSGKPNDELPPEPDRSLTDVEEVFALRYIRLLALGIDPDEAFSLIDIPDIAARAEALYAKGCPPRLIVEIIS